MPFTTQQWIDRFVADLALVIGAMGDGVATAGPGTESPSDGWMIKLRADAGARGELAVEFDRLATEALTQRILQSETTPSHEEVIDALTAFCTQAAASMVLEAPLVGVKLTVGAVEPASGAPRTAVLAQIAIADKAPLPLRLWSDLALVDAAPAPAPALAVRAPAPAPAVQAPVTPKLDVILDIDLPLTVRFGHTEMPLRTVSALGPGSVIDLGRSPEDPVDVLVSNQLVARGEVVIVGGNYGVRITHVISPGNIVRSLEERF